ncbi:MAG: hypothetical protein HKP60_08015 [Eudoraea sp.]|nr:hypothetical protein [Eudoraea sp.]NNJ40797.1 hypothetical protein [Eudoraea sp.]
MQHLKGVLLQVRSSQETQRFLYGEPTMAEIIPNEPARVMPGREAYYAIWMYSKSPE